MYFTILLGNALAFNFWNYTENGTEYNRVYKPYVEAKDDELSDISLNYFVEDLGYERKACPDHPWQSCLASTMTDMHCGVCGKKMTKMNFLGEFLETSIWHKDITDAFKKMSPATVTNNSLLPDFNAYKKFTKSKTGWSYTDMFNDSFLNCAENDLNYVGNGYNQVAIYNLKEDDIYKNLLEICYICNLSLDVANDLYFVSYSEFKVVINLRFFTGGGNNVSGYYLEWGDKDYGTGVEDRAYDAYTLFQHEFGHAASLDHTESYSDFQWDDAVTTAGCTTEAQLVALQAQILKDVIKKRLMYSDFRPDNKDDIPAVRSFGDGVFGEDEQKGYNCYSKVFWDNGETNDTNYDNCFDCIYYQEYYKGSGTPQTPTEFSVEKKGNKLTWRIESPGENIKGFNIYKKDKYSLSSVNQKPIPAGINFGFGRRTFEFDVDNPDDDYLLEMYDYANKIKMVPFK